SSFAQVGFQDAANGDYTLSASSPYKYAATDGTDPGVDMPSLQAALNGVGGSPPPPASTPTPTPTPTPPTTGPPQGLTNFALASNGGVATASSTLDSGRSPLATINGDRRGVHWGSDPSTGSGWHDASDSAYPDWLQIDFCAAQAISEIDVYTVQDNYANPAEPTDSMTFSVYGITGFDVQYWNGIGWTNVPSGSIVGNDHVKTKFVFSSITTSKIRVVINSALAGFSRITEVEAWGSGGPCVGPPSSGSQSPVNVALASNGATAIGSSTLDAGRAAV